MDDFGAGFGDRIMDVRDALGSFWYAEPSNAPETSFAGRVTLPITQELITVTSHPSACIPGQVSYPFAFDAASNRYMFSIGTAVYAISAAGSDPTMLLNVINAGSRARVSAITYFGAAITKGLSSVPQPRVVVTWATGIASPMMSLSYGAVATWTQLDPRWSPKQPKDSSSQLVINHIVQTWGAGTDTWSTLYTTYNGGSRPIYIWKGTSTLNSGTAPKSDLIFWDKKLMGAYQSGVTFLVPLAQFNHTEEVEWSLDDSGYVWDQGAFGTVTSIGEHSSGTSPAIPGAPGQEPWNNQLSDVDGEIVAWSEQLSDVRFIGAAPAPWGTPAMYLRGGGKLYALDFFARRMVPISIGLGAELICGCLWQGSIATSDGYNIYIFSPQSGTSRNIGMPKKIGGVPPNLRVGTGNGTQTVCYLFPSDEYLIAVVVDTSDTNHPATTLYRYNNIGWHQIGAQMTDFCAYYGFQADFIPSLALSGGLAGGQTTRYLIIPGTTGAIPSQGVNPQPAVGYYQFKLPNVTHQATVGIDTFGVTGARLYTGWIDGGFLDIQGTLLRLNINAFNLSLTETVTIEYQLDNDETANWVQMVDSSNVAAVFSSANDTLYFSQTTPKQGLQFRTVRFRITLNRGADNTRSPEIAALILVYLKVPQLRTAWTATIDVNRMVERSQGMDTTFWVDGVPATMANIWAKLKSLWNTHTLLPLVIPSIEPTGVNVRITDMPLRFDDFRTAVAGQGSLVLQMLEPVI